MNKPYVKQLDENGVVINPITKLNPHLNQFESRRDRRFRPLRFINNRKGVHLTVYKDIKYSREVQVLFCTKTERVKRIEHYRKLN